MSAIEVITLKDMDAWREFAALNEGALIEQYGAVDNALRHALDGGLRMGGGAAPIIDIVFEE